MGDSKYRATRGSLSFDAYYKDEWGQINSAANCVSHASERDGFHKNVFTTVLTVNGSTVEIHFCESRHVHSHVKRS